MTDITPSNKSKPLSAHDSAILSCIFSSEQPFGSEEIPIESSIARGTEHTSNEIPDSPPSEEAKRLELAAVQIVSERVPVSFIDPNNVLPLDSSSLAALNESELLLRKAIACSPGYASAHNNLAQVLRMKHDTDGALRELDSAIEQSGGRGRVACQAYTQRGLIHRTKREDEAAKNDLRAAAALGSEFAKKQLVALNPYAALCAAALSDLFARCHGIGTGAREQKIQPEAALPDHKPERE